MLPVCDIPSRVVYRSPVDSPVNTVVYGSAVHNGAVCGLVSRTYNCQAVNSRAACRRDSMIIDRGPVYDRVVSGPVGAGIGCTAIYGGVVGRAVYVVIGCTAVYSGIIGHAVNIMIDCAAVYGGVVGRTVYVVIGCTAVYDCTAGYSVYVMINCAAVYNRTAGHPVGIVIKRAAVYHGTLRSPVQGSALNRVIIPGSAVNRIIIPGSALYIGAGYYIARIRVWLYDTPGGTPGSPPEPSLLISKCIAGRITCSGRRRLIAVPEIVIIVIYCIGAVAVITVVEKIGARIVVISVIIIPVIIVGARPIIKVSVYIIAKVLACAVTMVILRHIASAACNSDHTGC